MCISNSKLYKVLEEDESMKDLMQSSKNITELFKNVSDRLNVKIDQLANLNKKIDYKYCVLNNIGCGNFTRHSFKIIEPPSRRHGYHALINESYRDPDQLSYKLYQYTVENLNKKINVDKELSGKIGAFKVAKRKNSYSFCMKSKIKDKEIEFGGDWIINWNFISNVSKQNQFEIAELAHSVIGHVFWPCNKRNRRQTVNQARAANKRSIKATLDKLNICYKNDFGVSTDCIVQDSLDKAFIDYADWYRLFGEGEAGYNKYIDFFSLGIFTHEEMDSNNILSILEKRLMEFSDN